MERISLAGDGLAPELLPVEELADCAAAALARDGRTALSYGPGAGYPPLRELIGAWFQVDPGRVVVGNGLTQLIELVARPRAFGRHVLAEYPVHDRAQAAFLRMGAMLVSVSLDEDGLVIDELRQHLIQYTRPVVVYTVPTFHNPTGVTMSLERRRVLVELIAQQDLLLSERIVVLENDAYALTRLEGERLPALFDLSGGRTVYAASFSPLLAPGLRVAWAVAPPALAAELAATATATYVTPALAAQATVFEFLRRGALEPQLERVRRGLRLRRDALLAALELHFAGARWNRPAGGLYVWLELPPGTDGRAVLARAEGVGALPGTEFGWTANALRLSYGEAAPDEIADAVARLAAAMP